MLSRDSSKQASNTQKKKHLIFDLLDQTGNTGSGLTRGLESLRTWYWRNWCSM